MSPRDASWRGDRHLRVALELHDRSVRVHSFWLAPGPVVQPGHLARPLIARVDVDGEQVLVQDFDDPRVGRATASGQSGHAFVPQERGLVEVSVPLPADTQAQDVVIRLADAGEGRSRPTEPTELASLFDEEAVPVRATVTADDLRAHPDFPSIASAVAGAPTTPAGFEIYRDQAGEFRWRLRRPGGEIVADSGEGYATREQCEADLRWVRANAGALPVASRT